MKPILDEIHERLGFARLNKGWAKLEIFLGLLAAGAGLLLGIKASAAEVIAAGLALFALGGYLALAGHRSHLYQSSMARAALLIDELRRLHAKEPSS
jgi:hypothetical protein